MVAPETVSLTHKICMASDRFGHNILGVFNYTHTPSTNSTIAKEESDIFKQLLADSMAFFVDEYLQGNLPNDEDINAFDRGVGENIARFNDYAYGETVLKAVSFDFNQTNECNHNTQVSMLARLVY